VREKIKDKLMSSYAMFWPTYSLYLVVVFLIITVKFSL